MSMPMSIMTIMSIPHTDFVYSHFGFPETPWCSFELRWNLLRERRVSCCG